MELVQNSLEYAEIYNYMGDTKFLGVLGLI